MSDVPEIREIEDGCGYGVSADGRAWSRIVRRGLGIGFGTRRTLVNTWRPLKLTVNRNRRLMIPMRYGGKQRLLAIHRAVLTLFVGPCPEGLEACHNDGNPANNVVENLRWDTHKNNMKDKSRHGTHQSGVKHAMHRLKESDVLQIRSLYQDGHRISSLSKKFGVTIQQISNIVYRRHWKHI